MKRGNPFEEPALGPAAAAAVAVVASPLKVLQGEGVWAGLGLPLGMIRGVDHCRICNLFAICDFWSVGECRLPRFLTSFVQLSAVLQECVHS